jgi:hypothetical protein
MNVDHLFNDDSLLMIPSRPPSKELYQRLDELRGSGCCQYVNLLPPRFHANILKEASHGPNGAV